MFKLRDKVRFKNPPEGYEKKYPEIYLLCEIIQIRNKPNNAGQEIRVSNGTDTFWDDYKWKIVGPKYKKNLPAWF